MVKMLVDELLEKAPFIARQEKNRLFLDSIKESLKHHYDNSKEFRNFIDSKGFDIDANYSLEDIPYFPVSVFKHIDLITGDKSQIKKKILSSSTSGNKPSKIFLDNVTINRQRKALISIMSSFISNKKKLFIIFDSESTIKGKEGTISSRASAIRGLFPFARSIKFVLNNDLTLNFDLLKDALSKINEDEEVCFFGFTWIVYSLFLNLKKSDNLRKVSQIFNSIRNKKYCLHIGGWKKLTDILVSKESFNKDMGGFLGMEKGKIIDFYGMTEQLGTVYPDCEYGYKHVPLYSEIIIRDVDTFGPCSYCKAGFIQLITPLPNSYPGISIVSDDIGEIIGEDDCRCGRLGKYFIFKKRVEKSEAKGCGDTYE